MSKTLTQYSDTRTAVQISGLVRYIRLEGGAEASDLECVCLYNMKLQSAGGESLTTSYTTIG